MAALFLWLMLKAVDLRDIANALKTVNVPRLIFAAATFLVGYACRIERWRLMMVHDSPTLTWRACAGPFLASFAANNVLPFRAGDVLRIFAFNRHIGVSSGIVVATLFVERLLDLLTVLIFLGVALAFFDSDLVPDSSVGSIAPFSLAGAILLILIFPRFFAPLLIAIGNGASRLWPKLGRKLLAEINRCVGTLSHLSQGRLVLKLIGWSLIAWTIEGAVYWFVALALPTLTAPIAGWLALPLTALATLIPSAPGYIGTFDFFAARAMTELGNNMTAGAAYALLVHLVIWLPITFIGSVYWLLHSARQPAHRSATRTR